MAVKRNIEQNMTERIILHRLETVPENYAIHHINLKVAWGRITVKLDEMKEMICQTGSEIDIPAKTKMVFANLIEQESEVILEKGR